MGIRNQNVWNILYIHDDMQGKYAEYSVPRERLTSIVFTIINFLNFFMCRIICTLWHQQLSYSTEFSVLVKSSNTTDFRIFSTFSYSMYREFSTSWYRQTTYRAEYYAIRYSPNAIDFIIQGYAFSLIYASKQITCPH